ncbi:phosphate regulon sensor histidine kinase PhoR [Agarilytica rhodophyticola]|uniref:phosphate regulon sensor histidine kinase PhoR n=1 Tax=Agarilytica rhodophyticola TaxID=1737490 RepID=UPI000B34A027|nr:phosphate regulon sensor histidine kinase PhoR [Agarilytica rhodophyticola]
MSRGLKTELRWLAFVTITSFVIGFSFDAEFVWLSIALFLFIIWLLYRTAQLESWAAQARRSGPPGDDFGGIWGEIADDIRLLSRRYEKDKVRLQAVVTRVQEMTSALADAVILVDSRANIEWWNRSSQDLFNFQDIDRGHKLVNIIRNPRFINYFETQSYSSPLELESLRNEGQHLEFHVHPFGQGERLIVIRDVTRVNLLEQMRKDFVSNVSHELRTPLTVIKGYIETLIDAPDLSKTLRNAFNQMLQQSDRMTALVNDLITLSRLETDQTELKPKPVALSPLLETIVSDAQALGGKIHHQITLSGDAGVSILGNNQELHSAFSNLTFNAVKYSPEGGGIDISVTQTEEACIVSVTDSGLGIDPKHIPRLTERFYRVDDSRSTALGGTGLGLAIVKHVLARHDAELKITSHLGKGSSFSCYFPIERILREKVA